MQFSLEQIKEASKNRPQGYLEEVLALATKANDDWYYLSDENFAKIAVKYRLPSVVQMIKNLAQAGAEAINDPTRRTEEEMNKIAPICAGCPYLIVDSFRCVSCGCFLDIKMQLKAWNCPLDKWPV
jgi:hypothetical protein